MLITMLASDRYILFIDESGKSKLSDEGDYILLCGLIINKDLHTAVSNYMISLKRNSDISTEQNLHAFDIFEDEFRLLRRKNPSKNEYRITHSKISTLFERIYNLIDGTEMKYLIVTLDKKIYQDKIKRAARKQNVSKQVLIDKLKKSNMNDFLYQGMTQKLILEFAHFLDENNAQGEVVAESRRNGDAEVLNAFLGATQSSNYEEGTIYRSWSMKAHNLIHRLTFENKKGLSFGLEIADLFAWSHYNNTFGRKIIDSYSDAKNRRIDNRLVAVRDFMRKNKCMLKNGEEKMTETKFNTVAKNKVSEFTKILES